MSNRNPKLIKKLRIRSKVKRFNRSNRKRICIDFSNKHISAQLMDDEEGKTLLTVTSESIGREKKNYSNKDNATKLAEAFIEKIQKLKIPEKEAYIFDRGNRRYHGKVQVFADKLREKGMVF